MVSPGALRSGPCIKPLAAKSTTPIARKCRSGSRSAFEMAARRVMPASARLRRYAPDRRGVGAFLDGLREMRARLDPGANCIPRRPAAGRILDHARVVEGVLTGVEFRIAPRGSKFGIAP